MKQFREGDLIHWLPWQGHSSDIGIVLGESRPAGFDPVMICLIGGGIKYCYIEDMLHVRGDEPSAS